MYFKLMIFSALVFASPVGAEDSHRERTGYDPNVDIISDTLEAGPYLIYDCLKKHYACVLRTHAKRCQRTRRQSFAEKKLILGCAPIAQLPNKKSCFQKQLFMVSQNHGTRFCIGPLWKEKEIDI